MEHTARLKRIMQDRIPALVDAIKSRESKNLSAESCLIAFSNADPTRNKTAVEWMIRAYSNGQFLLEDLEGGSQSTISETLKLFGAYRKKLSPPQRDINTYDGPGALWDAIKDHLPEDGVDASSRERKKLERETAERESVILRDDDTAIIAVPLTKASAMWWGKGTRWCTSATNNNVFDRYNKEGPLFIIIDRNSGLKYQAQGSSRGSFHFLNASDRRISQEELVVIKDVAMPIVKWIIDNYPIDLYSMPSIFMDRDTYLSAVKKRPENLWQVPKKFISREIYVAAVSSSVDALSSVPEKYIDHEMCLIAVKNDGNALKYVPDHLLDEEICMEAVRSNGMSINHVPENLVTSDMIDDAVYSKPEIISTIPLNLITPELSLYAVSNNGILLKSLPLEIRSNEIIEAAIKNNGKALRYIPLVSRTEELCMMALNSSAAAIEFTPDKFLTYEICMMSVKADGETLQFIPDNYINSDLCLAAVSSNGKSIQYVPKEYITQKICEVAAENNAEALQFIPEENKTHDMCLSCVQRRGEVFECTPVSFRDEKMYIATFRQGHVPRNMDKEYQKLLQDNFIPQDHDRDEEDMPTEPWTIESLPNLMSDMPPTFPMT